MSTSKTLLLNLFFVLALSSCSRDIFINHSGNMPSNERISQIKQGQTKDEVLEILGTPSSVISLDQNVWIYMSSDIEQIAFFAPTELNRDVLTIRFNQYNQIAEISRITKEHGKEIEVCEDKTETLGSQPGFFEKYFGGVGQFMPFGTGSEGQINK